MKLFQKLLIAPAALGLFSPLSVLSNELNLDQFFNYSSDSENLELSIDSFNSDQVNTNLISDTNNLVNQISDFEASSFSETTTMSGYASFQVGAVDNGSLGEGLTAIYSYGIDLNTSFNGNDNLYVGIETGNAGSVNFVTGDSVAGSETLSIDSIYYQFSMGNHDVVIGPKVDNDDLMPTTISTYSDKFFMGGMGLLESNFWLYGYTGPGIAVSRVLDNGFNYSGSVISTSGSTESGILTDEGIDVITLSLGYDGENYGGGIVYVNGDDYCGMINTYLSSACTDLGITTVALNTMGIGAYWTPNEGRTMISATSNLVDATVTGMAIDNISDFQLAVDHEIGNGVLSASWKTIPLYKVISATNLDQDTLGAYFEVYYTHQVNDALDLTYGVAFAEPETDSGDTLTLAEYTAVGVQANFKF